MNAVRERLEAIPTIGYGLARMAVLILARDYGRLGGRKARRYLEPKPDMHVRRVFERSGLVERGAAVESIIRTARTLAQDYPAAFDAPAWDVGRNWCRPRNPKCRECPIHTACPRVGVRSSGIRGERG